MSEASFHTAIEEHEKAVTATLRQAELHAQIAEAAGSPAYAAFQRQLADFKTLKEKYLKMMAEEKQKVS
jgi:hypothetical protein